MMCGQEKYRCNRRKYSGMDEVTIEDLAFLEIDRLATEVKPSFYLLR